MPRFGIFFAAVALAGAAVAQDGPPPGSTDMQMTSITVQGQNQLRGRYGTAWEPGEVREEAAKACAGGGLRLILFRPGKQDKQGRTEFVAVCQ